MKQTAKDIGFLLWMAVLFALAGIGLFVSIVCAPVVYGAIAGYNAFEDYLKGREEKLRNMRKERVLK